MVERVHKISTQLWIWGPVVGLMLAIFIVSAQPKNPPPPGAGPTYLSGFVPVFQGAIEPVVKKGAHVAGYALLTLAFLRAFRLHGHPRRRSAYLALVCAMGYALTDEFHQAFVPGRHASLLDIGFDSIGTVLVALTGVAGQSKALPGARGEHTNPMPKRQTHGLK
jgi:VanZ family protein